MQRTYLTTSPFQTKKLGKSLARKIRSGKKATVIGLKGDLGGGKTTFLQGFAEGLGVRGRILSPTFIVIRRMGSFYHIDSYRLRGPQELLKLGFREMIADPKNTVAVEWADKVEKIIPKGAIWVGFKFIDKNKRKITIKLKDGK